MGDNTGIQWTDASWNPVTGCTKVSLGCAHCYAEDVANRFWHRQYRAIPVNLKADGSSDGQRPREFTDVQWHLDRLDQPLRWRKPRRVFVNSMSDLFHEEIPNAFIDQVFAVMALSPRHTFQVLTKRAQRMRDHGLALMHDEDRLERFYETMRRLGGSEQQIEWAIDHWPLPNVWLGVSVENQRWADERIPLLFQTSAAVRFLSCEPLLAPIDLKLWNPRDPKSEGQWMAAVEGVGVIGMNRPVDWVIIGGESGPHARPCDVSWIRSIRDQCRAASVPCFVKQLGSRPLFPDAECAIGNDPIHGKGGNPSDWPADLRVRDFPE